MAWTQPAHPPGSSIPHETPFAHPRSAPSAPPPSRRSSVSAGLTLAVAWGCLGAISPVFAQDYAVVPASSSIDSTTLRRGFNVSSTVAVRNVGAAGSTTSLELEYLIVANPPPDIRMPWRLDASSTIQTNNLRAFTSPGATNETVNVTSVLVPPESLPLGSYSLRVIIDPDAKRTDTNRSNNSALIAGFAIDYYLVPESALFSGSGRFNTADARYLGRRNAPPLPAVQQFNPGFAFDSESFVLPPDLTELTYLLGAVLDPGNTILEKVMSSQEEVFNNQDTSVAAEAITVRYVPDRPDYWMRSPLGSGAASVAADLFPYEYFYSCVVDDAGIIPERTEANNSLANLQERLTVTAPQRSDLTATGTGAFTPTTRQAGQALTIQAGLSNHGFSPSGPFDVTFFLSTDTQAGNADDLPLGTARVSAGLGTGASATFSHSLTLPAAPTLAPGTYRLG